MRMPKMPLFDRELGLLCVSRTPLQNREEREKERERERERERETKEEGMLGRSSSRKASSLKGREDGKKNLCQSQQLLFQFLRFAKSITVLH